MKKIGFVTAPLYSGDSIRGIGFYTKRLLQKLGSQVIEIKNAQELENQSFDLVHYPYFNLFTHTLPIFRNFKTVVTIHDVIPLEFPDHYPSGLKGWLNLQLQKLALFSVDRVITDSYASINNIHKYLGVPHDKLKLVYLAADEIFKQIEKPHNKYKLPAKFVLYVGDVNYNKNIPNLVQACQKINTPLVIVGKQALQIEMMGLNHPELQHLKNLNLDNTIRLGFVNDEDLVDIYNLATVYCQPSLSEGFGLPVLEALACGTPVACSNLSSLPELGGDKASYFDPYDVDDIAKAIKAAKAGASKDWLAKFSWKKAADDTLMVYGEIA